MYENIYSQNLLPIFDNLTLVYTKPCFYKNNEETLA